MAAGELVELDVKACRWAKSGVTNGKEWSIFEVDVEHDGVACSPGKVRSFSDLDVGLQEFQMEARHDERWGTSYTIKPTRPRELTRGEFRELEQRVALLERAFENLERQRR